jgi:hypothetical protein
MVDLDIVPLDVLGEICQYLNSADMMNFLITSKATSSYIYPLRKNYLSRRPQRQGLGESLGTGLELYFSKFNLNERS